jgi:hypothetical protein
MKKDTGRNARAPFFLPLAFLATWRLENLFFNPQSSILNPQSPILNLFPWRSPLV